MITIRLKGQASKPKGAICKVPVDAVNTYDALLRTADSNKLVLVRLKSKLEYRGHVYFDFVWPSFIFRSLHQLNVQWYEDQFIKYFRLLHSG